MEFTGERYVPEMEGQIKYEHLHRYALCLQFVGGKNVLDMASGEGYGAALLATAAKSVTGVDIDTTSVDHAKHLYYKPNLTFLVGSCEKVPLPDNSFDVVTSFETIEHHGKHDEMLDEIKRVLKPGGVLIISSPNRLTYSDEPGYKNPFHVKELYYDEFYELLGRRFKSIRMFGQRLAAGSFVFPLGTSGGSDLKSLTGDAGEVTPHSRELPSPIYFVAVCSDDAAIESRDISSVYFDRSDDLFKTMERQRVDDIRRMQQEVHHLQEVIAKETKGYQAEIARLSDEIQYLRTSYERDTSQQREMLRHRDQEIADRDDAVARLRAHWAVSEKNIQDHAEHIRTYERLLSEAQIQLGRYIEVLNRIYASRSWRISSTLREAERMKERLARTNEVFKGELESVAYTVSDVLEISGWAYSTAASVNLVEAFLDDFYMGSVHYGEERDSIPGAPSRCGYSARISLHGFNFDGERTLRIRAHDQSGNKRSFERQVRIVHAPQRQIETPVPVQIFQGKLESPQEGSPASAAIEISGWMYSKAAPITFIEAFLGEVYLGRVTYGIERHDVLPAFPMEAPLRCGFSKTLPVKQRRGSATQALKLRFYDSRGNIHAIERPLSSTVDKGSDAEGDTGEGNDSFEVLTLSSTASRSISPETEACLLRIAQVVAEFRDQFGRDPSILDWDSGFDLKARFPSVAVFSPPAISREEAALPYLDHTIDIVVVSSADPARLSEARRVSVAAIVRALDSATVEIDRPEGGNESPLESVSIIIPVHNAVNFTQGCLDQLTKTLSANFRGEIIVIDDASTDETPSVLKKYAALDSRIKALRNPKNAGFIGSCNRAAHEASGDILIFLNNDTLPKPGWLEPLLRVLRDKADAGAVGGKLIYPDGTLQEAGGIIFSDGSGCNFGKYDKAANAPLYSFLRQVDYCSGALLATPRKLFLEAGGFDTRFTPAYYEDTDYCFTLRAKGYRVYYQPESVVVHFEGISSGTDITTGVKSYQVANRVKFVEKWRTTLQNQPSPPRQDDFGTRIELSLSRSV